MRCTFATGTPLAAEISLGVSDRTFAGCCHPFIRRVSHALRAASEIAARERPLPGLPPRAFLLPPRAFLDCLRGVVALAAGTRCRCLVLAMRTS
jgi:hypothetical protein